MSIRFISNSSRISAKWEVLNNNEMNHMPDTGIKGIDLYYKTDKSWQYLATGRPQGLKNEYNLIQNMTNEEREYKIYLPFSYKTIFIYSNFYIFNSIIQGEINFKNTIVFYGTSITQGGCASRPGMIHTNIISRKLDIDVVNFGFSGNGRMEQPIGELISQMNPLFYVIECMPNMIEPQNITNNTIPLVDTIRKGNPDAPIIFVDLFDYSFSALNSNAKNKKEGMNAALKAEFEKMQNKSYQNIFYVNSKNSIGSDMEGTVDGVHFTDLGYMRYYLFD